MFNIQASKSVLIWVRLNSHQLRWWWQDWWGADARGGERLSQLHVFQTQKRNLSGAQPLGNEMSREQATILSFRLYKDRSKTPSPSESPTEMSKGAQWKPHTRGKKLSWPFYTRPIGRTTEVPTVALAVALLLNSGSLHWLWFVYFAQISFTHYPCPPVNFQYALSSAAQQTLECSFILQSP